MLIPIRKILWSLLAVTALLAAAHLWVTLSPPISPTGFRYDALISVFNVENEANIPNWFSTVLLFTVALASLVIQRLRRAASEAKPRWNFFWPVFAVTFLVLSLEEAAGLRSVLYHTLFNKAINYVYIPFGLALVALCSFYFFVIERKDRALQRWIISGLVIFVIGGLGGAVFDAGVLLKEWLEMAGTILVLCGCLREINALSVVKN
jgi:hypothetical protein